jgi:hypothetical protein
MGNVTPGSASCSLGTACAASAAAPAPPAAAPPPAAAAAGTSMPLSSVASSEASSATLQAPASRPTTAPAENQRCSARLCLPASLEASLHSYAARRGSHQGRSVRTANAPRHRPPGGTHPSAPLWRTVTRHQSSSVLTSGCRLAERCRSRPSATLVSNQSSAHPRRPPRGSMAPLTGTGIYPGVCAFRFKSVGRSWSAGWRRRCAAGRSST